MFDYVLNTRLSLVVNQVWANEEPVSLICMKNQQKATLLTLSTCTMLEIRYSVQEVDPGLLQLLKWSFLVTLSNG